MKSHQYVDVNCLILDSDHNMKNLKFEISQQFILKQYDSTEIFKLNPLGKGGSATVTQAYHIRKEKFIAIKQFNTESQEKIKFEHFLLSEIETLRQTQYSPYFLEYYGVFKDPNSTADQVLLLEMESGLSTLDHILSGGKQYSCSEILFVLKNLVDGFAILQQNGIAHRDLKESNIVLVKNEKGSFDYKISDFGIGIKISKESALLPMNSITGLTIDYAAPEILQYEKAQSCYFDKNYNPYLADVYSLGLIIAKMINRKFRRKKLKSGMHGFLEKIRKKFTEYELLIKLLEMMLDEDPENRSDFIQLKAVLDKLSATSKPENEDNYFEKWVEMKERTISETNEGLKTLFLENIKLHKIYSSKVTYADKVEYYLNKSWKYFEQIENRINFENVDEIFKGFDVQEFKAMLLIDFGDLFIEKGNFSKAEEKYLECFEYVKEGKLDRYLPDCYKHLGDLYLKIGNLQKAEEFIFKSFDNQQRIFGENHIETVNFYTTIARFYDRIGKSSEAEEFFRKCLEKIQNSDKNDISAAGIYNNLGVFYQSKRGFFVAEKFYKKALQIYQNVYGENHSDIIMLYNNLGDLYLDKNDLIKAEEFYLQSCVKIQNLFGENYPVSAHIYLKLGDVYRRLENLIKSEEFTLRSLRIRQIIFGESNESIAFCYEILGLLYTDLANFVKAENFLNSCLKIRQELFGDNDFYTANCYNNLGRLYAKMGNLLKAKEYLFKSLTVYENFFDNDSYLKAISYINIAKIYQYIGDFTKSEECLYKSLKINQKIFEEDHFETANSYTGLGKLYKILQNFEKAEDFFLKSLRINRNFFGENDFTTATNYKELGNLYKEMRNLKKSELFLQKALEILQNISENHPDLALCSLDLGSLYLSFGRFEKSEKYHLKCLKVYQTLYGEGSSKTALIYGMLGILYKANKNIDKTIRFDKNIKLTYLSRSYY